MAQGRLSAAACCAAVLAAGAVAEHSGHGPSILLSVLDYAVGAGFAIAGALLLIRGRRTGWLSLAAAAAWYTGTAAVGAASLPAYLGDVAVVAYRGFLINLVVSTLGSRRRGRWALAIVVVGYLTCLVPYTSAGFVTSALMLVIAIAAGRRAWRAPADTRTILTAIALASAAVAVVWALAAAGVSGGDALQTANDLLLLDAVAVVVSESARGDWLHGAISALVVDLGPSPRRSVPVKALLAAALADPDLDVRYRVADLGWFDDAGSTVEPPPDDGDNRVTRVAVADVGDVAIIHGATAAPATELTQAAATAAALALDSARVRAEARQQASAVRESGRRLLAVADAERQGLEAQLRVGPVGRLQRVGTALAEISEPAAAEVREQLTTALEDLGDLANGLFPGALAARPMDVVLGEVAATMPIPVQLVTEDLVGLADELRALTYFFCSECMANISRHANATTATVDVRLTDDRLSLTVEDNGQGGATLANSRGLRGLADRIEVFGGRLSVTSPIGGPTSIHAEIPIA
jgi:hypothetical protein